MPRYLTDVTLTLDVECAGPEDIEMAVMGDLETLPALFIKSAEFGDFTVYES